MATDDFETLSLFHQRVINLASTKLVKGTESNIRASIKIQADSGLQFTTKLPPEEQLAQFLMAFRFFYLKKEKTHFPKILAIVAKYSGPEFRQVSNIIRSQWDQSCSVHVLLNSETITSSKLIDLWFNAHYFHGEVRKQRELDRLNDFLTNDFCKFMFLDSLYNASDAVRRFHAGIGELFVPAGTVI
jgi:hypothetical protein